MLEDSQIIELYWLRDEAAIAHTADKYGGYCRCISYNILTDSETAEECVNDAYLHTWNAIPPSRPSLFRAWLGKIVRNLSLDRYKRSTAKKRGGDEVALLLSELEHCISSRGDVETAFEDMEIARRIGAFLREAGKENRLIFLRRYFYGDSVTGIARRYGMSESKVKSSLFRTRNALKAFLEAEGVSV